MEHNFTEEQLAHARATIEQSEREHNLPTFEEVLANPAFTEAQKAEYRGIHERHIRETAEQEVRLAGAKARLQRVYTETLELATQGLPVSRETLAQIAQADDDTKPNLPKPKKELKEIKW